MVEIGIVMITVSRFLSGPFAKIIGERGNSISSHYMCCCVSGIFSFLTPIPYRPSILVCYTQLVYYVHVLYMCFIPLK